MGYVKQSFVDGKTVLSASHLNHIEDGIVQLEKSVSGSTSSSVESFWDISKDHYDDMGDIRITF